MPHEKFRNQSDYHMAVTNVPDKGAMITVTIPDKVKVGAMTYTIEIVPNMFADRSLFGEVTYANQRIKIAGDVSADRRFNIFVHELYHAVKFEAGEQDDQDEREVLAVSNVLTQVFVENGLNFGGEADE